jgi:hypothetical protein
MRTWTVFVIIGALIVGALTVLSFREGAATSDPAMQTAAAFVAAVNARDTAAVEKLIDPTAVTVNAAAGKLTGLDFKAIYTGNAFLGREASKWTFGDLSRLQMTKLATIEKYDVPDAKVPATVRLELGYLLWMRKVDGTWRIFYLEKPNGRGR